MMNMYGLTMKGISFNESKVWNDISNIVNISRIGSTVNYQPKLKGRYNLNGYERETFILVNRRWVSSEEESKYSFQNRSGIRMEN